MSLPSVFPLGQTLDMVEPTLLAAPGAEENLAFVRRYLEAMETALMGDALAAFFTDDAVSVEFPNRVTPNGARRDIALMKEAAERGAQVCTRQRYQLRSMVAVGQTVAVELLWIGTLARAIGSIPAGGEMRAHFAAFYELRNSRIAAIRNYDCFEPF